MVDMEKIRERLMKGAYVGVGGFLGGLAEGAIEDHLNTGDLVTAGVELGIGLGASVGVDEFFEDPDSLPNDFVEYAGYGMQGNAWSNMAEFVQTGELAGTNTVTVRSDGSGTSTGKSARVVDVSTSESTTSPTEERPFAAEVA